jgi:hypothetical protein
MNPVERLREETERLVEQIDSATDEQLAGLLEVREEALNYLRLRWAEMSPKEQEDNRQLLRLIGAHDAVILDRMRVIRDQAAEELKRIRQARSQQEAYQRKGYANSLFFDEYK